MFVLTSETTATYRAVVRVAPFQVEIQQGGGALALIGEPYDADQAKFVPTSAHDFNSTQVMIENDMLLRTRLEGDATTLVRFFTPEA